MRCPFYARVAQSVEQLAFNQWVGGSIPFTGTTAVPLAGRNDIAIAVTLSARC